MQLLTKESIDFFMQVQLQRHPTLLLKASYLFHELSETTQAAYLEVRMNGCSGLGKVYIHPHSSLYSELVNNNCIQALQTLI